MLKITSLKLAWAYGEDSSDFPDDTPVHELLGRLEQYPYRILNTDMLSVIIVPHRDQAELLVVAEEGVQVPQHRKIIVALESPLGRVRNLAAHLAQDVTRRMSMQETQSGPFSAS